MTEANNITRQHRPLMAGIAVMPSTGGGERGTLSGIARRNSDNVKVLVTCQHVLSTEGWDVDGNEWLYEGGTGEADKIGQLYTETIDGVAKKSWRQILSAPYPDYEPTNPLDAVALLISDSVREQDIKFQLHDHPNHTSRPIVAGCVDAEQHDRLFTVGAVSGEGWGTVESTVATAQFVRGQRSLFRQTLLVDRSDYPSEGGDSGAPYLVEDELGNYRMVGIHLGSLVPQRPNERLGENVYVLKASVIEDELGITFGLPAPTAAAGAFQVERDGGAFTFTPVQEVRPRETVYLRAAGSRSNIDGDTTLTYKWELQEDPVHPSGVTITNSSQATARFTAPDEAANLIFRLIVADGNGAKAAASVTINVVNTPPVAKPGLNRVVNINSPVTLVGAAKDPDAGHVQGMAYVWSVASAPSGNAGSSARSTTGSPSSKVMLTTPVENGKLQPHKGTFTPNVIGDYVFTLTVTDPGRLSHSDTMRVKAVRESENLLPTNISALPGHRSIDVSWTGVSIATGYEVQVGVAEDGGEIGYKSYTTTALTHRVENLAHSTR